MAWQALLSVGGLLLLTVPGIAFEQGDFRDANLAYLIGRTGLAEEAIPPDDLRLIHEVAERFQGVPLGGMPVGQHVPALAGAGHVDGGEVWIYAEGTVLTLHSLTWLCYSAGPGPTVFLAPPNVATGGEGYHLAYTTSDLGLTPLWGTHSSFTAVGTICKANTPWFHYVYVSGLVLHD